MKRIERVKNISNSIVVNGLDRLEDFMYKRIDELMDMQEDDTWFIGDSGVSVACTYNSLRYADEDMEEGETHKATYDVIYVCETPIISFSIACELRISREDDGTLYQYMEVLSDGLEVDSITVKL